VKLVIISPDFLFFFYLAFFRPFFMQPALAPAPHPSMQSAQVSNHYSTRLSSVVSRAKYIYAQWKTQDDRDTPGCPLRRRSDAWSGSGQSPAPSAVFIAPLPDVSH
jgi:hypothetical protein